jgi:type 1 glutamine amidotransferase
MRFTFWRFLTLIPAAVAGAVLVAALPAFAADDAAPAKISVLIVDGQNNHNWKATTAAMKEMLEKTRRFTVDVATTPGSKAAKEAWDKFRPDFAKYGAVLMNYNGDSWPEEVCKSFEKYMTDGGGLVFYHAAVFAFADWKAFNDMMGMGWRNANQGMRLTIDADGKEVRTPSGEGPGSGHGPSHAFGIDVRDPKHPVMEGLPAKFMHVKDELYHGMRGPLTGMHILATAFSDKKSGGTDTNEPMVWTVPVGKGKVLVTLLGHDVAATTAPSSAVILNRGLEWVATGKVTLSVPKELAAEVK